ncbi:MAG: copper resistance protein CopC [Acidimicrobiales bacterium]
MPARGGRGVGMARLALVLAVVAAVLGLAAGPAAAHAVVVSSTPADREQLTTAPSIVSIIFSEAVDLRLGGVTVLDTSGERVDDGTTTQPTPEQVQVGLEPDLPNGTYIVNYRVVSADGHPVGGALVFSVGTAIDETSASGVAQAEDTTGQIAAGIARFLAYLGALLASGAAFFTWFVHDRMSHNRPLVRLVLVSTVIGVVGLVALVVTQATLATGTGPLDVLNLDVMADTLGASLGWSVVAVLTGLAVSAVAMYQRNELAGQVAGFYGMLGVGVGFALWGHSTESGNAWLSISADAVHGASASLWFGGLAALSIVLVGRIRAGGASESDAAVLDMADGVTAPDAPPEADPADDAAVADTDVGGEPGGVVDTVGVVVRFSTMATISVVLLAIGGVALAWIEVGSLSALVESTYGKVLLAKLAVAAVVAVLAVLNHLRLLPAVLGDDVEPGAGDAGNAARWRRLSTYVRFEAIGLAAVLGLTAVLVGLTPPAQSSAVSPSGPFNGTKSVAGGQLNMVLTPALAGTNAIHLQYQNAGRPADIAQNVTLQFSLPEKGIGPIERVPVKAGVGHWTVNATDDLSIPGTWKVEVVTRLGEFEQERTSFDVPVT